MRSSRFFSNERILNMKTGRGFIRFAALLTALLGISGFLWAQPTTVAISPATPSVLRGETITLSVNVNSVANLLASHEAPV
jgi:hypothetical protein